MLLVKDPIIVVSMVWLFIIFGFWVSAQQMPEEIIVVPEMLVILPPHKAVVLVRFVAALVVIEGNSICGGVVSCFLQLNNRIKKQR